MDIGAWLQGLGLGQYEEAFRENDVDLGLLRELTAEDLRDLGVASVGHRRRLLDAIAALAVSAGDAPVALTRQREPPSAAVAERRQLTVMFVDLVGSTELTRRLDPEEMGQLLRDYQATVVTAIEPFGGRVAKFMGDGVLAYFGWPQAFEDAAERAIRAGLAVTAAAGRLAAPDGSALAARVGIATGLVLIGDLIGTGSAREEVLVGETANLAARLQTAAQPGQVLIGQATRRLAGDAFFVDEQAGVSLKGFGGHVPAYAVTGERRHESRFEAHRGPEVLPLFGRDQELTLLLERWAQAKTGEGQGVLLVGEAGIGKSRIAKAMLDTLKKELHARVRHQCSPYHQNTALWPVVQQLFHAARIAATDPLETKLDKLEAVLAQAGQDTTAAPYLASLLGLEPTQRYGPIELTPQAQRARTLECLTDLLLGLAGQRPVLMLVEDAHWIDPTTLELIEYCLDRIVQARVLIVLTSRPDNQPAIAAHPHVTRLTLNRLSRSGVEAIIARLGSERLPTETVETIAARADGVPLFVEELTRAVLDAGEAAIPTTLHDSLMARLDRVPDVKELAQIAACIGRDCNFALLSAVAEQSEPKLAAALDQLVRAELLFRRGLPPLATYSFKHALVRDAAYHSLLRACRQELHRRIALVIARQSPETVTNEPELLARHYAAAGMTMAAVKHWELAGARAMERSAFVEAIHHFRSGLDLLAHLPDAIDRNLQELPLRLGLGDALSWTEGFAASAVEAAYTRASELSRSLEETTESFRILWGMWHFYIIRSDFVRASMLAQEVTDLARRLADPRLAAHVARTRGEICLWRGEFAATLRETAECVAGKLAPPIPIPGVQEPVLMSLAWQAFALWHLGFADQACTRIDEAVERSRQSRHVGDLGAALIFAAFIRLFCRDLVPAAKLATESYEFNARHHVPLHAGSSAVLLGAALVARTGDREGRRMIVDGIAQTTATGAGIFGPSFEMMLAAAEARLGDPEAGLAALARASTLIDRGGERWQEAELHRLDGELALQAGRPQPHAERRLLRALAVAREQQARSLELRAALSLAGLWAENGKRQQALDLLAPIYDHFTEGFDTLDLIEAKAVLDALD